MTEQAQHQSTADDKADALREAIWVAIHSAVDLPAEQVTRAAAAVWIVVKDAARG